MILKSWKEIANYIGSGVRTAQRWERLGMPIRRPSHSGRGAVVTFSEEIDAWLKSEPHSEFHVHPRDNAPAQSQPFPPRILVVDDNEKFLVNLAAILSRDGYSVGTARDGFEALAVMRGGLPDLLISDLRMPNMSGFELLSVVRRRFPSVAIIAESGDFSPASDPVLLCDRYIEKGKNSTSKLLEAVKDLLTQTPLRAQPPKLTAAPVWLPRLIHGYVVLTCLDCLRSFAVLTRDVVIGTDAVAKCVYCGFAVQYHIDDSVLPIRDDLMEVANYSREAIASGNAVLGPSRQRLATRKSVSRKA